jgi:DGQHR domain-containing protein
MADKGAALNALNNRVWILFEKAGFDTRPSSNNLTEEEVKLPGGGKRTLDLAARVKDLDVFVIGWNKAAKDLSESLTTHINDFLQLKNLVGANAVLFVATSKEVSEENRGYAAANKVTVWGESELRYYEAVVNALGVFAKYEIIHSLGIQTKEEGIVYTIPAVMFRQPFGDSSTTLFQFTMPPEKLLKTCVIYRRAQGSAAAYQRMLRHERLRSVRKFVTAQDALLPTNVIVHFGDQVSWDKLEIPPRDALGKPTALGKPSNCDLVVLRIPLAYASLELIDGQHRLYGFVNANPATQKSFNLVVLGIENLTQTQRRDTFVAINDKSRRMDANLVAYLKYTKDEALCQKDSELMAIRIAVDLNGTTPFKDRIRLLDIGNEKITLKGFSGYDLKGLLGSRGLLRQFHGNDSQELVKALRIYFNVLKSLFPKQWKDPGRYIIFTNRGISAFLKLLKSILKTIKKPIDAQSVRKYLQPLRDARRDSDWEMANLSKSYVGSQGWKDFHRDLVRVVKGRHREFKE